MVAKRVFMAFCTLYALARGIGTVLYYTNGAGQLQLAVLIISFAVSVIGLVAGILWIIQRQVRGVTVRLVLFLFSAAAIANIFITRVHPVPHGIGLWEILVTGTLFECLLFLLSLVIPMPDHNPRRYFFSEKGCLARFGGV